MPASALKLLSGLINPMTLAERIKEAMEAAGLSPAELARATKRTNGAVTQWLDGTTKSLKAETANLIEQATGYRASWLVTERGPKLVGEARLSLAAQVKASATVLRPLLGNGGPILAWEHGDELPPGEFVFIQRLTIQLRASNGEEHIEVEPDRKQPVAFRADWIRKKQYRPHLLMAMEADGDSMYPTICDGDSLVVDTGQTSIVDGKVYAIWYSGGERVKRLFRLPGGRLRIASDNKESHPHITLDSEDVEHVRVIGRVVHRSGDGGL